jgi:hypothetical protein
MEFLVENLGVEYPDYFQGYGICGTGWDGCCYGIGATESEAWEDCAEQLAQTIDLPEDFDARIEKEYGKPNDARLAPGGAYFHVGIKWRKTPIK